MTIYHYRPFIAAIVFAFTSQLFLLQAFSETPYNGVKITITEKPVATEVEPIGANLTPIMGGTNFAVNNHVSNSGFEPIILRKFIRINRTGYNWFEWDQEGGPGYWNLAWTGLLNGANVRFYRVVDKHGRPLPYGSGNDMSRVEGADHVVFLGESTIPLPGGGLPHGGYIANDDRDGDSSNNMERVYIEDDNLDLRFGDYAYIKLKTTSMSEETSPPDLREKFRGLKAFFSYVSGKWIPALVPHPQPLPEEFSEHGETCLEITFPEPGNVRLGQWTYHALDNKEGQWYSQLHPGASYRVSVWMRQEGLENNGRVRFVFTGPYSSASQKGYWKVGNRWQHFTYDFVGPEYPVKGGHIAHSLEFTGPGKVWLDNLVLYRYDEKHEFRPFTPHEISFDEMMSSVPVSGIKPAVRFYSTIYHSSSIEAMFTDYGNPDYRVSSYAGVRKAPATTIAQAMYWAFKSGGTPENRLVPYLTCNEEYTEHEWKALIEYLGVPYDPEADTPQSKPYAYLRYKYRNNNGTPWTNEFREIVVEYGNETWHNGAGGYGWQGWGRPGYVNRGGLEYGLFARYMFDDHVMKMDYWDKYRLGGKIKFVLGGNYKVSQSSYVEAAIQQGPSISYAGHANYVGPKWETDDKGSSVFNDHGVQMTLIGLYKRMKTLIEDAASMNEQLNRNADIDYKIIAYEGGPSGYWTNKDTPQVDELYGKSVAMGVAALDTWLYSSRHGFKHQSYLGFSSGKLWSSHTPPEAGGFRPHPGWLALTMRNRFVKGETMVETILSGEPKIHSGKQNIPLISSYAFKDDQSYSVFILSRKLDGVHDGLDFGDGYTPVTLHLPFSNVFGIKRYRLEGPDGLPADPRNNNLSDLQVAISEKDIDASLFSQKFIVEEKTGGEPGGIPPGSINLFVFELAY